MVTEIDTRSEVFQAVYSLLNSALPSGWYLRSKFPNVDTEFPLILLNPIKKTRDSIAVDPGLTLTRIDFTIQIITHLDSAAYVHDIGRDYIDETLTSSAGLLSLYGSNIFFLGIDDIDVATEVIYNDNTYLVSTMLVRFKL